MSTEIQKNVSLNTKENISRGVLRLTEFEKDYMAAVMNDPEFFILNACKTSDPHDQDNPIKSFPDKEYISLLIKQIHNYSKTLVEKSRQVMATWTMCAYILWDCITKEHRNWYVQSKKEDDSDKILIRQYGIWERLPEFLKIPIAKKSYGKIHFPETKCTIYGVAQNSNSLRQECASGIFVDESEWQDEIEASMTAFQPTLDGGGKLVMVSTPNGRNKVSRLIDGILV